MMKGFFLIACILLAFDNPAFSTEMKCDYGPCHSTYYRLGKLYECDIPPMPSGLKIFSRDKTEVTSVVGEHDENKSNDDVEAIRAHLLYSIHYFPSGLGNFFKNIKAISLYNCELKELHQSDFKQFPNLAYFRSIQNEIEVIEQGLFDYNPDLAYIELLHERRLLHIDPTVFDNLNNIIGLDMSINCYKNSIYSSTIDILEAIKVIKNDCVSSDYLVLETEIKQLESESKTLDTGAFKSSLKTFDGKNSNSVFLKYQPLKKIYESLKLGQ